MHNFSMLTWDETMSETVVSATPVKVGASPHPQGQPNILVPIGCIMQDTKVSRSICSDGAETAKTRRRMDGY